MDRSSLAALNVAQNLDDLANLDPRGYGVCRILYAGARKLAGEPLSLRAAKLLRSSIKEGDVVAIITGFVLIPHEKAEMDGIVSSMLLARALVRAFGAKPLVVCPEDCLPAVRAMAPLMGLHLFETIEQLSAMPISMGVAAFPKEVPAAEARARSIAAAAKPAMAISIEAPGANERGVYHNARGADVSRLEAKSDILYELLRSGGAPCLAIGDLGNEIGMGALGEHLRRSVPGAAPGACSCGCGGGIVAASSADAVVTATVSDWGCYATIAALAYLLGDLEVLHDGELQAEAIKTASRSGMIDMSGWLLPAVDGCDLRMNVLILELMRSCVASALRLAGQNEYWFEGVRRLGFFEDLAGG